MNHHGIAMEENKRDALEEVKQLQDLVRKLEKQNQQLRSRQNVKLSRSPPLSEGQKYSPNLCVLKSTNYGVNNTLVCDNDVLEKAPIMDNQQNCTPENGNLNYLDDIEIICLSDVDLSDDDSWLYSSPNGLTPEQRNESPYKWLRKDIDDPDNTQLQLAKTALISKLNELEILSPNEIRPRVPPLHMANRTISQLKKTHMCYKMQPLAQENGGRFAIDTRTFTKSKKKEALEFLSSFPFKENLRDYDKGHFELKRRGSDVSLDSIGTYTLTDANDVQEVARMQEESLRLSSPIGTPKRQSVASSLSSRRLSISSRSSVSDLDNTEHPSLMSQISIESNSVAVMPVLQIEGTNFSDHSSPSDSPYGSNISLNNVAQSNTNMSRRSLPNLNRTGSPASKLLSGNNEQQRKFATKNSPSGHRSDSNLLAEPKSRRTVASPTRPKLQQTQATLPTLKAPQNRDSSTPKSGRPTRRPPLKSGLPKPSRPASASRLLSGIPMANSRKYATEDTWSDGCF